MSAANAAAPPPRILVTGATGGLGRNAVRLLLARGVAVRASGRNAGVGRELARQGAQFVALDLALATPAQLAELLAGVDAVWHCAALSSPWGPAADFVAANVDATRALLAAAGQGGARHFVHISTPAIYFDYRDRADVPESFRPARYVNDYARTKAAAEALVQAAVARFPAMRCVILRPRAIFGPHDQVLIPRLDRLLRRGAGRLALPRGGAVTLDVTYVDNVVEAMWLATSHAALASGSAFNITNHEPVTLRDVLQRLFVDALGRPLRIVALPYPLLAGVARALQVAARFSGKEPALTPYSLGAISYNMTLDNMHAREVLGYLPAVSLAEGIARTAAWMRQHG
ncbi:MULTISPECIES: NAD-dependent epimerase/dehydratase family protein [unclassified Janthinobacterium]|uniref:NAD-dependent epimerase/dehydratase family protein n=1 Tax=unclassified Janthinobacterium TaxID=2610881 RepID=UPI000348B8F3|nr:MULTISPECIES: NAD-dependent epimerase/dehydratase family protein [unclassified Janthinobacterium]MEC5159728.1 nucleoside-diphosphate-sugar epimerase [Janthinobacterium sp. CG_S6]